MKRKVLIISTVLLVAVTAAWFVIREYQLSLQEARQTVVAPPAVSGNVVTFDGETFSPKELSVAQGTTVYFNNQSTLSSPMYVASDVHPTHEQYPGFDAMVVMGRSPKSGESLSFTFTKRGTWSYHDHNLPSAQGTITVK